MAKNSSGSGGNIYGKVPVPSDVEGAVGPAMKDLGSSTSNTINGSVKSKDTNYPEED